MAKNKNRKQAQPEHASRASQAEQAEQQSKSSANEARSESQTMGQGNPADVARKHQRRFGHN